MAAAQPSQADIQTVVEVLGSITSIQAATLLKKNNNNVEQAIGSYFENPNTAFDVAQPDNTWQPMDNTPSFRIDADDTANSSIRAAASRPNSRASYHPDATDLTPEHAAAETSQAKSLREQQEDQDLQKALALSRGEDIPAQENGVTGTGQQFGPAKSAYYDTQKWALTTTSATAREVFEHPPASKRRRLSDQPAFLRGSSESGALGALLTIYHSIPLAREALLLPPLKVHSYGYDPSWWSGTSDENTKSISIDSLTPLDSDNSNLLCEVQQYMAFLDGTNRAYGTVDALTDLRKYQHMPADSSFSRLLEVWREVAMQSYPDEQVTQIFTSLALKDAEYNGVSPITKTFQCLEAPVAPSDGQSLYDILDKAIWSDAWNTTLDDVWIDTLSEVFTMRFFDPEKSGSGLGFKPPAVWWPDRYLHECREISWEMRLNMQSCLRDIKKLESLQLKCQHVTTNDGRELNVRETLKAAAEAAARAAVKVKEKQLPNGTMHDDLEPLLLSDSNPAISKTQASEVESQLQQTIARIDRKLALLEERKQQAREAQRQYAQVLTRESKNPFDPPHNKFVLQGVATKPGVVYVRKPIVEDLIDMEIGEDGEGDTSKGEKVDGGYQWWRISWSRDDIHNQPTDSSPGLLTGPVTEEEARASQFSTVNGSEQSNPDWSRKVAPRASSGPDTPAYSIRKVKEYEVLKAARDESDSMVLVYANERALSFQGSVLPNSLKAWVDADNASFERELQAEEGQNQIERDEEQRRADGMRRWGELHSSGEGSDEVQEGVFEDVPLSAMGLDLNGGANSSGAETPASPSRREADGQPSPKRAREEEPPPYEAGRYHEMQEKTRPPTIGSRIGKHADEMLDKSIASEGGVGEGGSLHLEHAPLR